MLLEIGNVGFVKHTSEQVFRNSISRAFFFFIKGYIYSKL